MNLRSILAALCVALFSVPVLAQGCANQRAKDVAGNIEYGPANTCAGITFRYAGLEIGQRDNKCPTFALLTPNHQVVEPNEGTRTEVSGTVNATLITFTCKRDWLLWVIPDGYQCVVETVRVAYPVNVLVTKGC